MQKMVIGTLCFLKVLVLQWNSHPCFLIYICSRSKLNQNISHIQEWHQNTQNAKSLFTQRFTHYKTFTLGENQKPAQNNQIWLVVVLSRCFIIQPPVPDNHFLMIPILVVRYRCDCKCITKEKDHQSVLPNLNRSFLTKSNGSFIWSSQNTKATL